MGDDVVLAGQAGIKDHLEIGHGTIIGPKSTVLQSVSPGSVLSGAVTAAPHKQWLRVMRLLPKLPVLWRRVSEIERSIRTRSSRED